MEKKKEYQDSNIPATQRGTTKRALHKQRFSFSDQEAYKKHQPMPVGDGLMGKASNLGLASIRQHTHLAINLRKQTRQSTLRTRWK